MPSLNLKLSSRKFLEKASGGSSGFVWPNANNTGVPVGTSLSSVSGDINTTTDGQVIDALDVTSGTIFINHNNVTVKRCRVNTAGNYAIKTLSGKTGHTIQDCEILNPQNGIFGAEMVVQRCNIHGVENGITISGGHNVICRDNYLHDFFQPVDPHYDGIAAQGGCNHLTITHNRIDNNQVQNSCIFISDEQGAATDIIISSNWLSGAAYPLIIGGPTLTAVTLTNNLIGIGAVGFYNFATTPSNQMTISGNVSTRGYYLDGDVPPIVGTSIFTPSTDITAGSDVNASTAFRVDATLAAAIKSQFRLVFYSGATASMALQAVAFGKQSAGQTATAALVSVTFGGDASALYDVGPLRYIVSDWMSPGLTFNSGDHMLVGLSLGASGHAGTGLASSTSNANSYFGSTANMALANPAFSLSAGNDFGLARIETR